MVAYGRTVAEPRLSPTGDRLAFVSSTGGRASLVVVDADGGAERVVTSDPPPVAARAYGGGVHDWSPDGAWLVYAGADGALWRQPADGGPPARLAEHASGPVAAPAVAPDGSRVAYTVDAHHVAVVGLDDGGDWPLRRSGTAEFCFDPTWSADSAWVTWHEWDPPAMPWDVSRIAARRADGAGEVLVAEIGRASCRERV